MPHLCWMCPDEQRVAGCIERLVQYSPFIAPAVNPNNGQPLINPKTNRQMYMADVRAAWNWLVTSWLPQSGYQFPPNVAFNCTITNPARGEDRAPSVYCVQETKPVVTREQISAPYAQPVGNRGQSAVPLPMPNQPRTLMNPAGSLEPLPDPALPSNQDPLMGEIDGSGGTYMDIDGNGNEVVRQNLVPQPPPRNPGTMGG